MPSAAVRRPAPASFTCSFPQLPAVCTVSSIPRSPVARRPRRRATGSEVTGHVGDSDPVCAISDTLHEREIDEILISTLPRRLSRWMHIDLPSKVRGWDLPVTHVEGVRAPDEARTVDGQAA